MLIYNLNLFIVYTTTLLSRVNKEIGKNIVLSKILNFVGFLSMWIVAGFRYNVGTDYNLYSNYFNGIEYVTVESSIMEIGYMFLNKMVNIVSDSNQMIFLVTSYIILSFIFTTILKYSEKYELSIYLFITMYFYYSSLNITRQFIAIAITFYAIKYIINKKFIKYLTLIIIAGSFHNSAFIMLPFYLISQINFNRRHYKILGVISIMLFLNINIVFNIVFTVLPRYQKYIGTDFLTSDSNWMHFIVIAIVLIIAILIEEKLVKIDKKNKIYINALLFAAIFQLLGIKTVLFSRMVMYLYIYAILLIPNMLSILDFKLKPIVYLLIISVYYMNCFVLMSTGNSEVLPYLYRIP